MSKSKQLLVAAAVALGLSVPVPVSAQGEPPRELMTAASQSPGSLYVTYIQAWIELLESEFDGLTISQEPGGAAQNIMLVHMGESDFGITNGPQAYQAVHGFGWTDGETYDRIAALHPAYPASASLFTLASSDIETLADLNGKNVAVGLPGSGSDVVSSQLFEYMDIEPGSRVTASWEDISGMLRDGLVDAVFYLAGHPAGFIQELEISNDLRFINLPEEDMAGFRKAYPYYGSGRLAQGLYDAIEADMPTIVQMNFVFGSPDLPNEFVTRILETVYDNVDQLAEAHPDFSNTSFENVANIPVPFHSAAEAFYEERSVDMNVPEGPAK